MRAFSSLLLSLFMVCIAPSTAAAAAQKGFCLAPAKQGYAWYKALACSGFFTQGFIAYFAGTLVLIAVVLFLVVLVFGLVGQALGLPWLFWHDHWFIRMNNGFLLALLLAYTALATYLLDLGRLEVVKNQPVKVEQQKADRQPLHKRSLAPKRALQDKKSLSLCQQLLRPFPFAEERQHWFYKSKELFRSGGPGVCYADGSCDNSSWHRCRKFEHGNSLDNTTYVLSAKVICEHEPRLNECKGSKAASLGPWPYSGIYRYTRAFLVYFSTICVFFLVLGAAVAWGSSWWSQIRQREEDLGDALWTVGAVGLGFLVGVVGIWGIYLLSSGKPDVFRHVPILLNQKKCFFGLTALPLFGFWLSGVRISFYHGDLCRPQGALAWVLCIASLLVTFAAHSILLFGPKEWFGLIEVSTLIGVLVVAVLFYSGWVKKRYANASTGERFASHERWMAGAWLFLYPLFWASLFYILRELSQEQILTGSRFYGVAVLFGGLLVLFYGVIFLLDLFRIRCMERFLTPFVSLSVVMGTVITFYGLFVLLIQSVVLAVVLLTGFLLFSGLQVFKYRLQDLRSWYRCFDLAGAGESGKCEPVEIDHGHRVKEQDDTTLEPRLLAAKELEWLSGTEPIVLVCATGGGSKAAAWTFGVLKELELDPELRGLAQNIRLITGASGGMVGAAYYVATRKVSKFSTPETSEEEEYRAAELHTCFEQILTADLLSPTVRRYVLHDLPLAFFSPFYTINHRGNVLQKHWENKFVLPQHGDYYVYDKEQDKEIHVYKGNLRNRPVKLMNRDLFSFRDGEETGAYPSLTFSPMMVEDGRRLILSNLDWYPVLHNDRVPKLNGAGEARYSCSGVEFARLFAPAPEEGQERFSLRLSTAAMLSASFPFVTPACELPVVPQRRIVDAGYYDNFGVNLAINWVMRHLEEINQASTPLQEGVKRPILLLQIDAFSREHQLSDPAANSPTPVAFLETLQDLTSPLEGVLNIRSAVPSFRNDELLHNLHEQLRAANHHVELHTLHIAPSSLTQQTGDDPDMAPLSRYLNKKDRRSLRKALARTTGKDESCEFQLLREWWKRHRP